MDAWVKWAFLVLALVSVFASVLETENSPPGWVRAIAATLAISFGAAAFTIHLIEGSRTKP